jgi:predicted small lipoprotein YifL
MTLRLRVVVLALLLAAGAAGCGQQGPLVLPGDARPVERIDTPGGEPEQTDDERRDDR